jgi:long-chain acyl-CoA synthetase
VNSLYKDILLYISQEQEGDYKTKVEYCRTHPELDMMERRNIFQPIHDKFLGGRIDTFFCGGAYLDAAVGEFFHIIGIEVFNAYGITECAPNISTNTWYCRRINSVGIILPHMKLRIEEDEIVLSGDNITKGYYKQPELTAAAIKDGWFYTGDLGRVDEDNYLYITGRKKNLIILSNGENISPEEIEQAMYKYEIVKEVVVYEDNDTIVAEVFCDCTDIEKSQIAEIMQEAVKDYNDQNPWYRQIHTLKLREVEFEKTASGKIMRNINRRTSNEGNNN